MALYAIADTHLSFGTDKPMDSFPGWSDYTARLAANWRHLVESPGTVVIAGDISWAMKFSECTADFAFLNNLPGQKILLKGNHDYWWNTKRKMDLYLQENHFDTLQILHNQAIPYGDVALCGSRGWFFEDTGGPGRESAGQGSRAYSYVVGGGRGQRKDRFSSLSACDHRECLRPDRRTVAAVRRAKVLLRPSARRSRPVCF